MMADKLDGILRQALTPTEEPAESLNQRIFRQMEEKEMRKNRIIGKTDSWAEERSAGAERQSCGRASRRIPAAAIAAALALGLGSVSALAAVKLLNPAQVTESMGDEKLTEVFAGEDATYVGETQSYGGYEVTFLGIASGKNISDGAFYQDGVLREDRSYTVVSIANSDGTPMPDTASDQYDISDFFVTPLIQGCDPVWYNAFSFGCAAEEMVLDGVRYRLTECDNMEMFADRELYLGVMDGMSYNNAAYAYDAASGKITRNEDYQGLNALFKMPLDASKADPGAAADYLEKLRKELFPADPADGEAAAEPTDDAGEDAAEFERQMKEMLGDGYGEWKTVEEWYHSLTPENIDEYAVPVESTRKILTPDADGYIADWDFEVEGRCSGESGKYEVEWLFRDTSGDRRMVLDNLMNAGSMDSAVVTTFTLNADGTVTFVAYIPKEG